MRWNRMMFGAMAAALASQAASAQEPPRPPEPPFRDVLVLHGDVKLEKAAFMGISTSPASPTIREQLKLPRGMGLVVDMVEPGAPADSAGIKPHDVLHKFNDQLLISTQQFTVLVRSFKPGEQANLTLYRQGEMKTVAVKLGEREMPPVDLTPSVNWLGPGMGDFDIKIDRAPFVPDGRVMVKDLLPLRAGGTITAVVLWADPEYTLQLTIRDGSRQLTARDKDGKQIFDGPVDTEEQRKAVPEAIRGRLEKAEKSGDVKVFLDRDIKHLPAPPSPAPRQ